MTITQSNFERQKNELYETEKWATGVVLKHFPVAGLLINEPAAGNHKIADVLRSAGATVICTDIATYNREQDAIVDYLDGEYSDPPEPYDGIYTNPPFGAGNHQARRFCEKALDRCDGWVAMLLTAKFDFGLTRRHLFADNLRFTAKIVLLDRIQWFESDTTGTEDHAWYVWAPVADGPQNARIIYEENPLKSEVRQMKKARRLERIVA